MWSWVNSPCALIYQWWQWSTWSLRFSDLMPLLPMPLDSENTSLRLYFPSNHVAHQNKPKRIRKQKHSASHYLISSLSILISSSTRPSSRCWFSRRCDTITAPRVCSLVLHHCHALQRSSPGTCWVAASSHPTGILGKVEGPVSRTAGWERLCSTGN